MAAVLFSFPWTTYSRFSEVFTASKFFTSLLSTLPSIEQLTVGVLRVQELQNSYCFHDACGFLGTGWRYKWRQGEKGFLLSLSELCSGSCLSGISDSPQRPSVPSSASAASKTKHRWVLASCINTSSSSLGHEQAAQQVVTRK